MVKKQVMTEQEQKPQQQTPILIYRPCTTRGRALISAYALLLICYLGMYIVLETFSNWCKV